MNRADPSPLSKAEGRRRQILDAAADCARRAGFHGARMAEIAQAAGVSVGQIYRCFESKEAIIGAIIAADLAETHRKIGELERSGQPMVEAIAVKAPQILAEAFKPARAALMLEVAAEAARNPNAAVLFRDADAEERLMVLGLLRQAAPDLPERELAARAEMLRLLFDGLAARAVAHPAADLEALAEVFCATLRLLFASPGRA